MSVTPQKVPYTEKSGSNLDHAIRKIKDEFIKKRSSNGQPASENSEGIKRLLEIYYNPGVSPSGLVAQVRQRILIVENASAIAAGLAKGDSVEVNFGGGASGSDRLTGTRIVRVSEYPNDDSEFDKPTKTVLLAWDTGPQFIQDRILSLKKDTKVINVIAQFSHQADNFIINPRDSNSPPDPPIASLGTNLLSREIAKADYSDEVYKIIKGSPDEGPTPTKSSGDKIKVVVSDTGLKFNLNLPPDQLYLTSDGRTTRFPLAVNPNSNAPIPDANRLGFCSITNYLDDNYLSPPANQAGIFPPTGIPADDSKVLNNPHDDNHGRHGTCITGIITHNPIEGSEVIPLKVFDFLGIGTYFDILCGFNYVFSRLAAGENIRIVNASWGAYVPDGTPLCGEGSIYNLLEKKIAALESKDVFVTASAGNRRPGEAIGRDISVHRMVPACYSSAYSNVITVTTVAEKWKKQFLGFLRRSRYVTNELESRLFKTNSLLERFFNLFFCIVPDGYVAIENYSSEFVKVGVVAHPIDGAFPMPFGGPQQPPLVGSSFATAFMSAYVVDRLTLNPTATRDDILDSLKTHPSLYHYVEQGRYLELDTVTKRSIEKNFKPVIRAILSST